MELTMEDLIMLERALEEYQKSGRLNENGMESAEGLKDKIKIERKVKRYRKNLKK